METALDRVRRALPMLKLQLDMWNIQEPGGKVMLGILRVNEDGSGRVVAQLHETTSFLDDLAEVAGVKDTVGWTGETLEDLKRGG